MTTHLKIRQAVNTSQQCQRNWLVDLTMPQEDIDTIIHSATHCPSKQNMAFYSITAITNRQKILQVHGLTQGYTRADHPSFPNMTNTQTLANLLLIFEQHDYLPTLANDHMRSNETADYVRTGQLTHAANHALHRDSLMAMGIASGYANLTAALLGYASGYCACFDELALQVKLELVGRPRLILGIGYPDPTRSRLEHQTIPEFVYDSKPKYPIPLTRLD